MTKPLDTALAKLKDWEAFTKQFKIQPNSLVQFTSEESLALHAEIVALSERVVMLEERAEESLALHAEIVALSERVVMLEERAEDERYERNTRDY